MSSMNNLHYIIIVILIAVIILIQLSVYRKMRGKLKLFSLIFPEKPYDEFQLIENKDGNRGLSIVDKNVVDTIQEERETKIQELQGKIVESRQRLNYLKAEAERAWSEGNETLHESILIHQRMEKSNLQGMIEKSEVLRKQKIEYPAYKCSNDVRNTIITSINNYLCRNNSAASDFNLLKDIVDRNADSAEDEVQNQIPVPLYCGLVGTMLGIIVGIGYLFQSGDINALLDASKETTGGAEGIKALLGGVALAMISSVFGIYLTTRGSWLALKVKSNVESAKHNFLSWMQAELLPVMNTDAASAMRTLVENLAEFNDTFAYNTKNLNESLAKVSQTTKDQVSILDAIKNLNVNRIATANIQVYDKLKNCTDEIGKISEYLHDSQEYLAQVRELNNKLDDADQRSRMIEEMATYFKEERASIDAVSGVINRSMGEADAALQKSVEILRESITKQNDAIVQHMVVQGERLAKVLDEQQRIIEKKSSEMSKVITEITQLTEVKKSMSRLEKVMSEQNKRMENLIKSLPVGEMTASDKGKSMPKWLKVTMYTIGGLSFLFVVLCCAIAYFN